MTADTGERAVEVVARALANSVVEGKPTTETTVATWLHARDLNRAARNALTALHEAGLAVVSVEKKEAL